MSGLDYKSSFVIKEIFEFLNHDYTPWSVIGEKAFFIHGDIFNEFSEKMNAHEISVSEEKVFDMKIGKFTQNMYLVWLKHKTQEQVDFLFEFFASSIYSFPWETSQNKLYLPVEQFGLLEEFIHKEQMEKFVVKIRIDNTHKFSQSDLKIIEFHDELDNRVTNEFSKFVTHDHEILNSYFMVQAFQYFKPSYLEHIKKPLYWFPENMIQITLLLEYHRNQAKIGKEVFNLFDIISMKMGVDDIRWEYENCEFHKLIDKMLTGMSTKKTYIKNKEFNLAEYQSDRAITSKSIECYQYLLYNFQHHFDRVVVLYDKNIFKIKLSSINRISDLYKNLNEQTVLHIDGSDLDEKSSGKLLELLYSREIQNISINMQFDTNFVWDYHIEQNQEIIRPDSYELLNINIIFAGTNQFNFIENFLNFLKFSQVAQFIFFRFEFLQYSDPNILNEHGKYFDNLNPYIFNNFNIQTLVFDSFELNSKFIRAIQRCNYNRIYFIDCRLKFGDLDVLELLDSLNGVECIFIKNEENTCANIMHQIEIQLRTKPFVRFKNSICLMPFSEDFKDLKFFINKERTQLEVYHLKYNEKINFYDFLYDDNDYNIDNEYHFYE